MICPVCHGTRRTMAGAVERACWACAGRWRVVHINSLMFPETPWNAIEPGHEWWHESPRKPCGCRRASTWREAFDYADARARGAR